MKGYKKIKLTMTCPACPEQYEAFYKGVQIGYLRLRHGSFTVDYPNVNGVIVYEAQPNGDGMFDDDERAKYLKKAKTAIWKAYKKDKKLVG